MTGIVLAGRPYHTDPEVNHGIPELIASYNMAVFTEDSVSAPGTCGKTAGCEGSVGLPFKAL